MNALKNHSLYGEQSSLGYVFVMANILIYYLNYRYFQVEFLHMLYKLDNVTITTRLAESGQDKVNQVN